MDASKQFQKPHIDWGTFDFHLWLEDKSSRIFFLIQKNTLYPMYPSLSYVCLVAFPRSNRSQIHRVAWCHHILGGTDGFHMVSWSNDLEFRGPRAPGLGKSPKRFSKDVDLPGRIKEDGFRMFQACIILHPKLIQVDPSWSKDLRQEQAILRGGWIFLGHGFCQSFLEDPGRSWKILEDPGRSWKILESNHS